MTIVRKVIKYFVIFTLKEEIENRLPMCNTSVSKYKTYKNKTINSIIKFFKLFLLLLLYIIYK